MKWKFAIAAAVLASCGSGDSTEEPTVSTDPTVASTEPSTDETATDLTTPDAASAPTGPEPTESTGPEPTESTEAPVTADEQPESNSTDSAAPSDSVPADEGVPATDPPPGETTPERFGRLAAEDLARRLGLDSSLVEIVSVEEVTWPDRSLGCPQKDLAYAQVLTPGIRIMLRAIDMDYEFHAGDGRDPFYCVDPQPPV